MTNNLSHQYSTAKRLASLLAIVEAEQPDTIVTLTARQWRRVAKRQRQLGLVAWRATS